MKIYVAGKWQDSGRETSNLGHCLAAVTETNNEWALDWASLDDPRTEEAAVLMREAVKTSDALILAWDDRLLGGLIEFGIACAAELPVVVYRPRRESTFWDLPNVTVARNYTELVEAIRDAG